MALYPITVNTAPEAAAHIYAEDDAAVYQSIFGADGVFNIGNKFKATILSNNSVRVGDGVLCVGGHIARNKYGTYQDMTIANGTSGKNRNDLIVAKFTTTGSGGVDSFSLVVKQGTAGTAAADPAVTQNDLYAAGKLREYPLYRVKVEGLSIVKVEQLFKVIPTIPELQGTVAQLNSDLNGLSYTLTNTPNGWYRKYNNGVLEQWGRISAGTFANPNVITGIVTFPMVFIDENYFVLASKTAMGNMNTTAGASISVENDGLKSAIIYIQRENGTFENGYTAQCPWFAIGRWK